MPRTPAQRRPGVRRHGSAHGPSWKPGSTLFLVWTQSRTDAIDDGSLSFGRDVRGMVNAPAENMLLLKVNYFLGW